MILIGRVGCPIKSFGFIKLCDELCDEVIKKNYRIV